MSAAGVPGKQLRCGVCLSVSHLIRCWYFSLFFMSVGGMLFDMYWPLGFLITVSCV